ncbi:MAG: exosortase-associated EpsI family protein [Chloroflexota bacterium]|nr:exosortase-associated EpsI family protein [Chloroflexota bacterium]
MRQYSLILGLSVLVGVIVLLLSASTLFFTPGVTFIDTDLHISSGDEVYVRTKMNFGSTEHMKNFPMAIGDWKGYTYDSTAITEQLGADAVVQMGFVSPGMYQPLFLTIVQAKAESSFHPPKICYSAQNYNTQEEGDEQVSVTEAGWIEESSITSIPFKKLVVAKESDGKITDRRVALFFYVKGNQFTTDEITMIRYEAIVPNEGSYEDILEREKQLAADTIPYMFEPASDENWDPVVLELAGWGIGGYFIIAFLLLVPVAIIAFPLTNWGRESAAK